MPGMGGEYADQWRRETASALEWWSDAGVDTLAADEPRDWLALPVAKAAAFVAAPEAVAAPAEILPDTLEAFREWRMGGAAPEAEWHAPLIGPSGDPASALMIFTDMPDPDDTEQLLSGAPGRLFDRILAAIGESRDSVYLASLALARPVTGLIPAEAEARLIELARHHVALAAPKKLLLVGDATTRVWRTTSGSGSGNGNRDINQFAGNMEVAAIRHPRFLLKQPSAKAEAWRNLLPLSRGTRQ